jgi:hypothetical protein
MKPQRCKRCGAPLVHPKTGRPKQFCCDDHRREWAEIMRPFHNVRPPDGYPAFHTADADLQLRDLYGAMRGVVRACFAFANEMELAGDVLERVRFEAAGAALEAVLLEQFANLEAKP